MDSAKILLACLIIAATLIGTSLGVVHHVGDHAGWTAMGIDYQNWASSKTFHVGDTIVFDYNNKFHDVMRVTLKDFKLCNITSEKASYHSGSDSIVLKNPGHHYYVCSISGHCEAGQKVDILVVVGDDLSSATETPSEAPSTSPPIKTLNHSDAITGGCSVFLLGLSILIVVLTY